jgi:nicotinamidase-related amidase
MCVSSRGTLRSLRSLASLSGFPYVGKTRLGSITAHVVGYIFCYGFTTQINFNTTDKFFMKALLIIDVQNAVWKRSEQNVFDSENTLKNINMLSNFAKNKHIPIFIIQHVNSEWDMDINSYNWKLYDGINIDINEYCSINKYHPSSFQKTNLDSELKKLNANELIICGSQSEFCIDTTCRHAYILGYKVTLIDDAHTTVDSKILNAKKIIEHTNYTLSTIVKTISTEAFLKEKHLNSTN